MKNEELFLKRNKEIKTYKYKDISITVKIDFDNGEISLMEKKDKYSYKIKEWKFAQRKIEYMQGWINILEAMQYAISEAKKELASYQTLEMSRNEFIKSLSVNK